MLHLHHPAAGSLQWVPRSCCYSGPGHLIFPAEPRSKTFLRFIAQFGWRFCQFLGGRTFFGGDLRSPSSWLPPLLLATSGSPSAVAARHWLLCSWQTRFWTVGFLTHSAHHSQSNINAAKGATGLRDPLGLGKKRFQHVSTLWRWFDSTKQKQNPCHPVGKKYRVTCWFESGPPLFPSFFLTTSSGKTTLRLLTGFLFDPSQLFLSFLGLVRDVPQSNIKCQIPQHFWNHSMMYCIMIYVQMMLFSNPSLYLSNLSQFGPTAACGSFCSGPSFWPSTWWRPRLGRRAPECPGDELLRKKESSKINGFWWYDFVS